MKTILVLQYDPLFSNHLSSFISSENINFQHSIYTNSSPAGVTPHNIQNFFLEIDKQFNNPKITLRKNIFLCFLLSRFFLKNYSFFVRTNITIFGKHRIYDFKSLIFNLRIILSFRFLLMTFSFFLGAIHFPVTIFKKLLFFNLKDLKLLQQSLNNMENNIFLFVTNGLDNLYFLLMMLNKPKNTKYFAITYSWDNISSKFILSKKLDHVALWNSVQQEEMKEIYGPGFIKSSVIGSKSTDRSYKFYSRLKTNIHNDPRDKTLLFLGIFNKSDEFLEVVKIHKLIQNENVFWYKKIAYRPHPLSRSNFKQIDFDLVSQLGIEINQDRTLNLKNYGGIICLPTSAIFDVLLSGVPAVLYAPKHSKYRANPYNLLRYKHFEVFRNLKPIQIITEFDELPDLLMKQLPKQVKLDSGALQKLFPKFLTDYDARIASIIRDL